MCRFWGWEVGKGKGGGMRCEGVGEGVRKEENGYGNEGLFVFVFAFCGGFG